MQLFSVETTVFSKNFEFFSPQKAENTILKSCSKKLKSTAQTEEFMFQSVAYRPIVYRTGVLTSDS